MTVPSEGFIRDGVRRYLNFRMVPQLYSRMDISCTIPMAIVAQATIFSVAVMQPRMRFLSFVSFTPSRGSGDPVRA